MATKKLEVVITGDAKGATKALQDVEGETSKFGDKLVNIGRVVSVAAAAAVTAVAVKGVMAFADFQTSMNEVFTLLPGISGEAMDEMSDQVKDFSVEFGVLPEKVVPALYQAISAGVPQENVFTFLETAQKAARGGVTELTTAVDGISSVVNAYGADVMDATQASDLMFTAVRLGKTTFEELSSSLFNVTPTAAALGVKFEDVTAALASMTAQGVPTTVATTQLRQLFVELSKEGTDTSKAFQEIAGKGFKEFIAEGGNTQQALQLLEKHAADLGLGVNDLFGSVEAGQAALSLTGAGTDKFSDSLAEMAGAAGATDAAFEQMDQGIGPLKDKFMAWAQVMLIEVGEKLVPVIEAVVKWFQENKTVGMALAGVVGGALLVAIGAYTVSMISAAAATVAATWPILAIIAAVAALVAGIVWAYNNVDWFREAVDKAADFIVDAFWYLAEGAQQAWDKLSAGAKWLWHNVLQPIWNGISWYIGNVLIPGFQTLRNVAVTVWNTIADAVSNAWNRASTIIGHFVTGFQWISVAVSGVASFIMDAFRTAFNWIAKAWNNTIGNLSFTIPSWVPGGYGGKGFSVPKIPTFHTGGVFHAPTAGGEGLALLRDGERVLTPQQAADSGGVTIVVQGSVIAERDLAAMLDRFQRRGGRLAGIGA